MSDSPTTRLASREAKQMPALTAALVAVCTAMAGGGAGSALTGQSVAGELKEFKAVVVGRFDQLEARFGEQSRNSARLEGVQADHEKRLHALELDGARRGSPPPR